MYINHNAMSKSPKALMKPLHIHFLLHTQLRLRIGEAHRINRNFTPPIAQCLCRENLPSSPLTHKALTVLSSPYHRPYTLTHDTVRDRHSQIATHCSLDRSHIIATNNSNGSAPQLPLRLFSGPTLGHSLSPLRATHGLRHSASQDVQTHRRQTHKDTHSWVENPPLPRTLLRTPALCSLALVMPLALGSIPCYTPYSSPFSFEAVEPVLFLTISRRELGLCHCSPLRSSPRQSPLFL